MPHLQLSISGNVSATVDIPKVLATLVEEFSKFDTVDPAAVKAYAHVYDDFKTGLGAPEGFIHLTVCVLEGRTSDLRTQMSDHLFSLLGRLFEREAGMAGLSLEIREMARLTYRK